MLSNDGSFFGAGGTRSKSPSAGDGVLNKSLTIVLPVYNGESRLRQSVGEILDLAGELTTQFGVVIVDDGSTDATFEVAAELAANYPQISVQRHRHRCGLGPIMDALNRHVKSDVVILHDGVTKIDTNQVRRLWRESVERRPNGELAMKEATTQSEDICDFDNLPAIHAAMQEAHLRMLGFQLIAPALPKDREQDAEFATAAPSVPRTDAAHGKSRSGVGQIPSLPRPKFLSALAQFALGE
jgi:Glycosyl transferase family 2